MPSNPHDHFFKAVFSRPTEAASFLEAHLPPDLAGAIRWDQLVCVKAAFQDHDGSSSEADLVFAARLVIDELTPVDIEIAILFEHQSTPDDAMPLRLLGYILRTFEAQIAERERKRPVPVIPIVLYHGERPWSAPTRFADWMAIPEDARARIAPFLPDFRYVLEHRRPPKPEAYRGSDTVRLARLVLDHARSAGFFDALEDWHALLLRLDGSAQQQGLVPVLAMVVDYVYRVVPEAAQPLIGALEAAGAHGIRDIAMNTYEQAIEKGKQIGLSEGKQIGLSEGKQIGLSEGKQIGLGIAIDNARDLLTRMCERRYGPLTHHVRERIESADLETLLDWTERFAFSTGLDDVFGGPPA